MSRFSSLWLKVLALPKVIHVPVLVAAAAAEIVIEFDERIVATVALMGMPIPTTRMPTTSPPVLDRAVTDPLVVFPLIVISGTVRLVRLWPCA